MIQIFPAQESEYKVNNVTYMVTPVFSENGKEDLAAKIKRLILSENSEKKTKK